MCSTKHQRMLQRVHSPYSIILSNIILNECLFQNKMAACIQWLFVYNYRERENEVSGEAFSIVEWLQQVGVYRPRLRTARRRLRKTYRAPRRRSGKYVRLLEALHFSSRPACLLAPCHAGAGYSHDIH